MLNYSYFVVNESTYCTESISYHVVNLVVIAGFSRQNALTAGRGVDYSMCFDSWQAYTIKDDLYKL